jgi:NifU-like protein involved in Fe-S cluster formation
MEYSAEVRRRFEAADGGHGLQAGQLAAGAEDRALGVWARFEIGIRGEYVERVRFHVFGCPHTIAAASLLAEWLEGQPLPALQADWSRQLAARLEVPEEKMGRLLVLEDALRACAHSAQQG